MQYRFMKKETSIAVGMGIVFGLVFSFLVIVNTQKNQSVSQKTPTQKTRPATTTDQQIMEQPVTITEPNDGAIIANPTVTLKGKTDKGSFVVVQTQTNEITFTTKSDQFEQDIPLVLGENIVHVNVYPKDLNGRIQEKELRVYYLSTQQ